MINIKKLKFKIYIYLLKLYMYIMSYIKFICDNYNRLKSYHLLAITHHKKYPWITYPKCLQLAFNGKLKYSDTII